MTVHWDKSGARVPTCHTRPIGVVPYIPYAVCLLGPCCCYCWGPMQKVVRRDGGRLGSGVSSGWELG